jgi:4-hydroxy-3-methylbut-2-enyl diphosphate reductase
MDILLANPRGFCAGVDRAIDIVERAIKLFGAPIYVRHEVVHNRYVVNDLKQKGAIFVDELDQVPDGCTVIFSAHGVSKAVQNEAKRRGLHIFDATCPLVTKVHMEVSRYSQKGIETILIGHKGHPEVEGTMGQYDHSNGGDIYLVESPEDVRTLKVINSEALRYVTQNRQDAVKQLVETCDLILIVGSKNSSNSNRLCEIAKNNNLEGHLIDSADDIQLGWLENKKHIGLSAGASAPELLVQNVIEFLKEQGVTSVSSLGFSEDVVFSLPKALR